MNKLYLVKRTDCLGYDECEGFVVKAASPKEARSLCGLYCGDEGFAIWAAKTTIVRHISEKGKKRIILKSFNAG